MIAQIGHLELFGAGLHFIREKAHSNMYVRLFVCVSIYTLYRNYTHVHVYIYHIAYIYIHYIYIHYIYIPYIYIHTHVLIACT